MGVSKKINPDLEWFRQLPVEKLVSALLFYKPDSEEGISPGYLRYGEDELALGRFLESLGDSPLGDRKEFSKKVLSFLGTLSADSLAQMRQELSASELAPYGEEPRPWIGIAAEKMFDAVNGLGSWVDEEDLIKVFKDRNPDVYISPIKTFGVEGYRRESPIELRLGGVSDTGLFRGDSIVTVECMDVQALAVDTGRTYRMIPFVLDMKNNLLVRVDVGERKENYIENIKGSRDIASLSYDKIEGELGKNFAGDVQWSFKLDLPLESELGIKGLRFLEYGDSFHAFALTCDGEATSLRLLPVRTLSKLSVAVDALREQKEMEREVQCYKDSIIDFLQSAYKIAQPTDEVIGGNFAKDFAGKVSWTRKLDFKVPGCPDMVGLRYIDFKDCTNLYVLYKDGNSRTVHDLSKMELSEVKQGLSKHVKSLKNKKSFSITP